MASEDEIVSDASGGSSSDEVVEELETEKGNKGNKRRPNGIESEDEELGFGAPKKTMRFTSEKEMKRLSKPATAEELNRLRETENLFHSNLFRLQIEEMLKEVQLKPKHKKGFQAWFEKFYAALMKLEDSSERYALADVGWLKKLRVKLPIPTLPQIKKGSYLFRKPLNVEVIGSYHLETLIGPKVTIDVIVQLPSKFYNKQDFENSGYHLKRALYLCDLMHQLQSHKTLIEEVNFVSDGINILKPTLEIIPHGNLAKYITVSLNVCVDMDGIDLLKFSPSKNNVNSNWFFNEDRSKVTDSSCLPSATPFYNSTILHDLTMLENLKFVNNLLKPHKNIRDGIILLKVWFKQRELSSGVCDFSGFLIAMLAAYLLQIRKINTFMSSYQVVRTVFNYLVSSDWTSNGITLCKKTEGCTVPEITEFHDHHQVVFVDTTGYYNLCYGMHSSTFHQVKKEAQIALNTLDNSDVNSFQILFMTPVPFYRHFDQLFTFHNNEALQNTVEIYGSPEDKLNYCGALYPHLINMMYKVLKEGFRQRVDNLQIRHPQKNKWKAQKKFHYSISLTFGLNLNPENYFLVVDKATESETAAFQEFWGDRSELRRFQDGTITEAVVWNAKFFSQKRLICREVVTYLMKYKFGFDSSDFQYIADQFDEMISENMEESAMKIIEVCDRLSKQLRSLKNLPLDVISVQGSSPVLRYTEPFPLTSGRINSQSKYNLKNSELNEKKPRSYEKIDGELSSPPAFINPIQLVLHMGATNKWPQDLNAIYRLRTAFYLKIAQSLANQCQIKAVPFPDRIELVKEGFVFHLKIFCPNEIGLVKQIVEDGLIKYRDNELSLAIERQMVFLPKINSALHGLYEQHSSFGPACCILKRWVNAQMLDSSHISEEVLEMLMASLFLKPTPHEIPQQPQTAFFRFLYMMASTNWNTDYVVLNINNELKRDDMLEIESHFTENRDSLPALFIVTPYDKKDSVWTKDCPTPLILLRLVKMCAHVLEFVEKRIYQNLSLKDEFQALFEPCLDPYDVIINLNSQCIARKSHIKKIQDEESETTATKVPVNGFDPAEIFLKELRESYSEIALFFYNAYGGTVIGVLWKPDAFQPKEFKIQNMAMHTLDSCTKKLHVEKELIIEDFLILGKGIVKSVDVKENGEFKSYTFL